MDWLTLIGGLTMGAAAAAIYDLSSSPKMMGDAYDFEEDPEPDPPSSGGGGGGGGHGGGGPGGAFASSGSSSGGPGVFVGPPGGGGGMPSSMQPSFSVAPQVQGNGSPPIGPSPRVSVNPEFTPGAFDQSFFGVSAPPWFGPLNYWPSPYPQNQGFICKKTTTQEGEDVFDCVPKYPLVNRNYTYGLPGY